MQNINNRIKKSVVDQLSPEEEIELATWIAADEENRDYYEKVKEIYALEALRQETGSDPVLKKQILEKVKHHRLKRILVKYVAAAIVLLIVGIGSMYWRNDRTEESVVSTEIEEFQDGIIVKRNNVISNVVSDGDYRIDKSRKEIVLMIADSLDQDEIVIRVGRGYQYKVTLPDSTKVWLNSGSKLSYSYFGAEKREVFLKGEACFDVVKDKNRPFVVRLNDQQSVTVLGTFFSVKAYDEDVSTRVSLVEGSVAVKNGAEQLLLTPNKEVIIDNESRKSHVQDFDSRTVKTWIAGGVVYYDEALDNIAKDLSRRFDKELIFETEDVKKERLTIVLDSVLFDDIITYIKRAGKGIFNVEQKGDKIIFKDIK